MGLKRFQLAKVKAKESSSGWRGQSMEAPAFVAQLELGADRRGMVTISGELNGYDFEELRACARKGVTHVTLRLTAPPTWEYQRAVDSWAADLGRHGVSVDVRTG